MFNARILIAEDEGLVAEDLRQLLQRLGYAVAGIVDTAAQAVTMAAALRPDLVLMDIRLEGEGDGIDAAIQLKQQHAIPFVFVTAHADPATLARATRAEPLGYVVKPFNERELGAAIETALYRHQAEDRLQRMERWLSTTLHSIGDAVIVADQDQRVTFLNGVAEQMTRWPINEALGQRFDLVFKVLQGKDRLPMTSQASTALHTGVTVRVDDDSLLVARDGTVIPIDDSAAPIRDDHGQAIGVVVVFRDCTERKRMRDEQQRMERRLQDAARLESLGVLAGGLAHDLNNILTAILGNASLCRRELAAGSPQQQHLQVIETSVHAAADLCRQMLTCAGIGPLATGPVDLNKIVGDGIDLVRGSLGPGVQVQTRLAAAPVASRGDPGQLAQVVMNLLLNAAEALPDGNGTVTVATGTMPVTAARLATMVGTPTLPAGDYAFLEVTDTGAGMSAATQARIFEPFFSTKSLGRGLGLPGVLGIVRRHGGAIRVDSVPGTGTMIRALLPQAEPPPAARAT